MEKVQLEPARTLDALHLACADFLREQGQRVQIASYDKQLLRTERAMESEIEKL